MHVWSTLLINMTVSITLSLGGLHLIRKKFPHPIRQSNNEVAGFFMAVLGVMYAVLAAFVIIVVWEQYYGAEQLTEHESNALTSIYRLSATLPEADAAQIRPLLREYARTMIDDEWPAMALGGLSTQSADVADRVWLAIAGRKPDGDDARLIQSTLLDRLNDLNNNRRLREMAAGTGLPSVMWVMLIGGGIVSVVFTYFFSTPNARAQYAMTALYVASMVFVLVLVRLLDYPFGGDVHVTADSFERSLESFDRFDRNQALVQMPPGASQQVGAIGVGR